MEVFVSDSIFLFLDIFSLMSSFSCDFSKAKKLNDQIKNLNQNLFCQSNPIPVKWALYKMGLIKNGIRLPLVELNDSFKESVKSSLKELSLI